MHFTNDYETTDIVFRKGDDERQSVRESRDAQRIRTVNADTLPALARRDRELGRCTGLGRKAASD